MTPMNISTSADALSKATYNALLYCPKEPPWCFCYIVPTPEGVTLLTSDSYSLAWSICRVEMPEASVPYAAIKIDHDALKELEERARKGKKENVVLEFSVGKSLTYRGEDSSQDMTWPDIFVDADCEDDDGSWDETMLDVFRETISERETDPTTQRVLLAPRYLQKLGRVKKNDKDQGADFWFSEPDESVLVKVGDDFRVAIEPIVHERHRAALGEGATW